VDQHCRITIVGAQRQADLAVPVGAPIASYIGTLARMCGQPRNDIMPAAWSLGPAVGRPFAPERSLAELGVLDGTVLYLRDVISDEFADPVVHDVAERVAEVAESRLHRRWDSRARTFTIFALGLGWLIAALAVLAGRHAVSAATLEDLTVVFGVLLPALAWTATERRWRVPRQLRQAMALAAVPLLALGAHAIGTVPHFARLARPGGDVTHLGLAVAALAVGALVGAVVAVVAVPSEVTCVVLLAAVVGVALGVGLAAAKANLDRSATAVSVVGFALLMVSPVTAARIVAFVDGLARNRMSGEAPESDPVDAAVGRAATLLVCWSGALSLLIGACLVPMAASHSSYCVAAAGCVGLAVLLRAGVARLTSEVVPQLLAGAAGILTLLTIAPGHFGWPGWTAPVLTLVVGAVLLAYGLRRLMRRPDLPAMSRPRWMSNASSMLGGTGVALAIAASGVFGWVVHLGRHI
jgi:hypothetical protein